MRSARFLMALLLSASFLTACGSSGPGAGKCNDGERRCADTATAEICQGGAWQVSAICSADEQCAAGFCSQTCQPACGGRQCGPDGCDGDCGDCAVSSVCNAQGQCVAEPVDCGNQTCDPDEDCASCPDDCGTCCGDSRCEAGQGENCASCATDCACAAGLRCDAQSRQCVCQPDCAGKQCGPDGCGDQCGQCDQGQVCSTAGQCLAEPLDCGDQTCGQDEDCGSCPTDCGDCCGDTVCEASRNEDCLSCPADCDDCCGDGHCTGAHAESCATCAADCACAQGLQCDAQLGECVCERQCQGKECGSDGCGGQCGSCGDGEHCGPDGTCRADCPDTSGPVDFDVTVVPFQGVFTTNGQPPGCPEYGRLFLIDQRTGARVNLIQDTCPSSVPVGSYDSLVTLGTYDAYFESVACGPSIPCDSRALIESDIAVAGPTARNLNIDLFRLQGTFTTNGQGPACPEYGRLYMLNQATGSRVNLIQDTCPSSVPVGDFNLLVIPGAYDVYFESVSCGPSIPCDSKALVIADLQIAGDSTQAFDISVVPFQGAFTTNGQGPACPEYGRLYLLNQETGSRVNLIQDTCPSSVPVGNYDALVTTGTYDAYFESVSCGPSIPCDTRALVANNLVITGPTVRNLNIDLFRLQGTFTTNGQGPACPEYGRLYMLNQATGSRVNLIQDTCPSSVPVGDFDLQVVPGAYAVYFETVSCGPSIPCDTKALVDANVQIASDTTRNFDVTVVPFQGAFTTNGQPPACPEYGRLYLLNQHTGSRVNLIQDTCPSSVPVGSYDSLVTLGTYDAYFEAVACGPSIPCDTRALVANNLLVTGPTQRDLAIGLYPLTGSFTTNGQAPACPEYGRLYMIHGDTGSRVSLIQDTCPSSVPVGDFDVLVVGGEYEVYFEPVSCGPSIPCASPTWVDCLQVP